MNDNVNWQELQDQLAYWSDSEFGPGEYRVKGMLAHLKKEVKELKKEQKLSEFADCMLLLLDIARARGFSTGQLLMACFEKLKINMKRDWGEPNEDGSVEHINGG